MANMKPWTDQEEAESELVELRSGVTESWVYMSLQKTWGDIKGREGLKDLHVGSSFTPVEGEEIVIAFPILGKEDTGEELRPNTISYTQYIYLVTQIRQLHLDLISLDKNSF